MIRAAILSLAFLITGVGTASAGECGKLCEMFWWEKATQEERVAEIATADVNARDYEGRSPLHFAASGGTPAHIKALLKSGANVNARSEAGRTPLHVAAASRAFKSANIALLLKAGANVNARDDFAKTPLHVAAAYGASKSANIALLLKAGADLNARTEDGDTPLHWAAYWSTPDKVLALLDAGADGGAKNDKNETPFQKAKENKKLKGTDAYWRLNDAQYD